MGVKRFRGFLQVTVPLRGFRVWGTLSLSIKIAQKPYIIGSLGPKALKYESLDAKGLVVWGPKLGAMLST